MTVRYLFPVLDYISRFLWRFLFLVFFFLGLLFFYMWVIEDAYSFLSDNELAFSYLWVFWLFFIFSVVVSLFFSLLSLFWEFFRDGINMKQS